MSSANCGRLCAAAVSPDSFRRQQPVGRYIVDFVSFEAHLVVELDGSQHVRPDIAARDAQRTCVRSCAGLPFRCATRTSTALPMRSSTPQGLRVRRSASAPSPETDARFGRVNIRLRGRCLTRPSAPVPVPRVRRGGFFLAVLAQQRGGFRIRRIRVYSEQPLFSAAREIRWRSSARPEGLANGLSAASGTANSSPDSRPITRATRCACANSSRPLASSNFAISGEGALWASSL